MTDLFLTLVNRSRSAGWLVLAAVVLRLVLKKAPKWTRGILWALVALRLICPVSIQSSVSLVPEASPVTREAVETYLPDLEFQTFRNLEENAWAEANDVPVRFSSTMTAAQAMCLVWMTGVVVLALYTAVSCFRLRRRMKTAVRLRENIWQSEAVASPFVLGLFRPRIYLPFARREEDTACVLAHEKAHIRRGDHWWKPLGFLLLTVYWFHPALWLAYVLFCRDLELACDERVIRSLDREERANYSAALLACSVRRRSVAACPLAFGETDVKERVKSVLHYKKPALWLVLTAILACAAAAVCFLTDPKLPLETPFGRSYTMERAVYDYPAYSFVYTPENSPTYTLLDDGTLKIRDGMLAEPETCGMLAEISLRKESFDDFFETYDDPVTGWCEGYSPEILRRNNARSWRVSVSRGEDRSFYLILQQKDGSLYLAYGYVREDHTFVRSVFRLKEAALLPAGELYEYSVTIYTNPLNSVLGRSVDTYLLGPDDFAVLDGETGALRTWVSGFSDQSWLPMTAAQWESLFPLSAPDISGICERNMRQLSKDYYLFDMDGALWLGEYHGEPTGMWSVYALKPVVRETLEAAVAGGE